MNPVVRRARAALGLAAAAIIVLTAVTTVAPAVPASAQQGSPAAVPPPAARTVLTLTIHKGNTPNGRLLAAVVLLCDPDGGTHPRPRAACTSLRSVRGRFEDLPAAPYLCPLYVDRVTGRVTGRWRGTPVHYVHTSTNRCMLARETDQVFGF
jgi:hypothetical protein